MRLLLPKGNAARLATFCRTLQLDFRLAVLRFEQLGRTVRMPTADDRDFEWQYADPNLLLQDILHRSPGLKRVFRTAAERSPPSMASPWRMVVAFDEVVIGNKLKLDNRRPQPNNRLDG